MADAILTQERLKQLLDYNELSGIFLWKVSLAKNVKAGKLAGCLTPDGYRIIRINKTGYQAHRLAWLYKYGSFPQNLIDHKNGEKDDNSISNLREASYSQNAQNIKKPRSNNKSGLLGVHWNKKNSKWVATIITNGESKHIGYFDTAELASEAYIATKKNDHEFCML